MLNVGDVFLAKNIALSGDNPHYHVVVHKTNDNRIIVVYTTKEIDKAIEQCKRKEKPKFDYLDLSTLVLLNNQDCAALTVPSAINCNHAQIKPESFFLSLPAFKQLAPLKNMSVLNKVKVGIKDSPIVEDSIKNLL